MNTKQIKVYIATTQGLVEVQSITKLHDAELRSVVTIQASSQLAGISRDYADFVEAPQGIVNSQFGGQAYRANLSADINQGTSWHLGIFIAHYLHANDLTTVNLQATTTQSLSNQIENETHSDLIIIASGEINTLTLGVSAIMHLDKKCALANAQISEWRSQGKQVLFVVPTDNYRKPPPDCCIQLTPISTLDQLPHLLNLIDVLPKSKLRSTPPNYADDHLNMPQGTMQSAQPIQTDKNTQASAIMDSQAPNQAVIIDAIERDRSWPAIIQKKSVLIVLFIWLIISVILYLGMSSNVNNKRTALTGLEYQYLAQLSENRATCSLIKELAAAHAYPNPYVASLNGGDKRGVSQLANVVQLPDSNIHNVCALTLVTSANIKAVWMLDESSALIDLSAIVTQNDNREWSLVLPSERNKKTRYYLLLFTQNVDAADMQSLQSKLKRLHMKSEKPSLIALSQWSTQLSISTILIEHALITTK